MFFEHRNYIDAIIRTGAMSRKQSLFNRGIYVCLAVFFACLLGNIAAAKEGFEHFGSWSNVEISKSEDPHATGFELTLWRYQGRLLGYLSQYAGPTADPPIGEVENLILDEKSGTVSFITKMSIGLVYSEDEKKWVPSKDLYLFRGTMETDRIEGTFEREVQMGTERVAVKEEVILRGSRRSDEFWDSKNYQEWKQFYAGILKSRGPKW